MVEVVLERAHYSCEVCGGALGDRRGVDWSIHHRRPRQMGGSRWPGINLARNLLVVCGSGTTGCHGAIESHRAEALDLGWLVPSQLDPAEVAVLIAGGRLVYLTDDGTYVEHPVEG